MRSGKCTVIVFKHGPNPTETHMKEPDQYNIEGYTISHSADTERDPDTGKLKQNFTGVSIITEPKSFLQHIQPCIVVLQRSHRSS